VAAHQPKRQDAPKESRHAPLVSAVCAEHGENRGDHWDNAPRPFDPRVLDAVRKSMCVPKIEAHSAEYHK
jgi:hypothetical protein